MKFSRYALMTAAIFLVSSPVTQAQQTAKPTSSDMQILANKIKADKRLVVAANMQLTEAEAKAFWPVYDSYQKDLMAINERMVKTVVAYAETYKKGTVSNETAKKLMGEALDVEEAEVKLKRSYLPKLEKAVSPMKAARYIQMENKIRAIVKFELAAKIPLVE